MRLDELYLWYLGDPTAPRFVGTLRLVAAGLGVSLDYDKAWLANGFALSEDLPLIEGQHRPRGRLAGDAQRAVGAVDDARPDRWGEKVIRLLDKPERLSLLEYLFYAGDHRFGALGVSTSSSTYLPHAQARLPQLESVQWISDVIARIAASETLSAQDAERIAGAASPLGGANPKALIEIDGEQWLVKFFNDEPFDAPLVEHATMTLAARAGISVAEARVIRLLGANAIAIRRFDRAEGGRIHAISAGTAIRAASESGGDPKLGYPALASVLRRIGDDASRHDSCELFRRMVFNILMDNTDDHEKNHSLLITAPFDAPRLRLAPAYDLTPTGLGLGYQEFICGKHGRDSTLVNAMSLCDAFGMRPIEAAAEVSVVIKTVTDWKKHFADAGVLERDIKHLARWIDGERLETLRTDFNPAELH
jgi:serine/threonine-protein kinase HipA